MKVAVVIPLHNHARYVGAALESLRVQSRPPDRVIIIDDGSTDGSLNSVIAYSEAIPKSVDSAGPAHRIQTRTDIIPQVHAGAQATINRGIALADDCDCVAILNSDDCYHPRRIERCVEYLQAHPDIDLICTRLRLIDEEGASLPANAPRARWFAAAWSFRAARDDQSALGLPEWLGLANFPATTSNFFARRTWLRDHPFAAPYPHAHDYHAAVRAALDNRLGLVDAELLDYRIHAAGETSASVDEVVRETLRINVDLARQLAPRLATEPEIRQAFSRYHQAAWSNVSAFRADLFNLILVEALALLPSEVADALLAEFDGARFPEIGQYPDRAAVNGQSPATPAFGPSSGLADKFFALKAQLSAVRASARPWAEYRRLQAALLESRWFALGRLLGLTRPLHLVEGTSGAEKLAALRERLVTSHWLRLGRRFGSASAARLFALGEATTGAGAAEANLP